MRCIFIIEESYEVHTHWGWFRLDEGAYRDYLQNKLWITWQPHTMAAASKETNSGHDHFFPPCISESAIHLRDEASKKDVFLFLKERFPNVPVSVPFKSRMKTIPIHELSLSVRSSNCLMRSGASTFGKLHELINNENGLRSIRNLGLKSEIEISHCFFVACYYLLSPGEKAQFWQKVIDLCPSQ